ncbi:hypothetical protein AADZ91_16700 [Colwelliaceae bacterium 6441]
MSSFGIHSLIQSATVGDTVDLKTICRTMNIKLKFDDNLQDLSKIGLDDQRQITIWLNNSLDNKTKSTLVAIAVAEYIISPEKVLQRGVVYDVFFLKDLQKNKATNLIMLATRLAIPEHIIEKLTNSIELQFSKDQSESFDPNAYIANAVYLPEFIKCAIKQSSSMLLIDNVKNKF